MRPPPRRLGLPVAADRPDCPRYLSYDRCCHNCHHRISTSSVETTASSSTPEPTFPATSATTTEPVASPTTGSATSSASTPTFTGSWGHCFPEALPTSAPGP